MIPVQMITKISRKEENDQQAKTIRHLQTRIKLLEKSQNELYKTTNVMERENKTLKSQLDYRVKAMKTLKSDEKRANLISKTN